MKKIKKRISVEVSKVTQRVLKMEQLKYGGSYDSVIVRLIKEVRHHRRNCPIKYQI